MEMVPHGEPPKFMEMRWRKLTVYALSLNLVTFRCFLLIFSCMDMYVGICEASFFRLASKWRVYLFTV